MRRLLLVLVLALAAATSARAGGMNRVYLVPALAACPGPANCSPREFESTYTFDTIVLRTPATKYSPPGKPSLALDVKGVRDAGGTPVSGTIMVRVLSGRVSIPQFGTFPDDSPLTQVDPQPLTLKAGNGHLAYKSPAAPDGLVTNGGGVEVLDPAGKRLAVTGSQTKP